MNNDEKLLKQADEFLDMAFLGDGKEQSLMYKMKARLEELTADKEPKSIVWEPKIGETYYAVNTTGYVWQAVWAGSEVDLQRLKHHIIYKTRALAEKAGPYLRRFNMVLQAVRNLEPDQVVDWQDASQIKYQVFFHHSYGVWELDYWRSREVGYPLLTDEKNVQPLLDYLNRKEQEKLDYLNAKEQQQ